MGERDTFSFEQDGQTIDVSVHEDDMGWPSVATQQGTYDQGATHEEILMRAYGPRVGRDAIKALRELQGAERR